MIRKLACMLCAAGLAAAALAESGDAGLYLYKIPSSLADGEATVIGETVQADLYVPRPEQVAARLAAASGIQVVSSSGEYVTVSVTEGDTIDGAPAAGHLAATFVMDYQEPAVSALIEVAHDKYGPQPSIDELINYVYNAISNKSYRRSFDIASQIAGSREGDCTEHAVLLTSIARAVGMPARLVFGILLVRHERKFLSFGHAWAEIHDGGSWRIADATRPEVEAPGAWIRYLPMQELGNEGPGYTMEIMQFAMMQPQRIDRVRSVPGVPPVASETDF